MIAAVLKSNRLENWRFYPFSEFAKDIAKVNDPALGAALSKWVAENKNDPIPLLIRAQYYYDMGWFKRGNDYAAKTRAVDVSSFEYYMTKALADIDASIRLDDGNPYSFLVKLRILRGYGFSKKFMSVFRGAITKHRGYYPLYAIVLDTLQPKWGGTLGAMYGFVGRYAGNSAKYSPLRLLYLELYSDLLNNAWTSCDLRHVVSEKMAECIDSVMGKTVRPGLVKQVKAALRLYDHCDKHQFDVAVGRILPGMLGTSGGGRYAGAILMLAADAMHSDTQLVEDKPGHNDYVIDEAAGDYWFNQRQDENAEQKYKEALKDVKFASFPNEEEKDVAIASIYEDLAKLYENRGRYVEMIAYEKAAFAEGGGVKRETHVCWGYFKLRQYHEAIRTCTKVIDSATDLHARYWRGISYWRSGRDEAAIKDLAVVADSESDYRTSAAINLGFLYAKDKKFRKSLDPLNKYSYLFDPKTQSKKELAIAYNNRCYDYMKLGERLIPLLPVRSTSCRSGVDGRRRCRAGTGMRRGGYGGD